MKATCGGCPVKLTRTTARDHEAATGHTVTVWDTPTTQLPRDMWAAKTLMSLGFVDQQTGDAA